MARRIFLARPRLDCSFKPGPVPEREGPPTNPIRVKLLEFLERLESYHRDRGDEVVSETRPLWQFELAAMQAHSPAFDVVYFPHKQRSEFNIGPNALFYKQTAFPEWCTVDRMGWGAGLEQMFDGSAPGAADWNLFRRLQARIDANVSKFRQPDASHEIPLSDYDLFVCQIPHDEAILLHSDVTVEEALRATIAFAEQAGRQLLVKGHPANPKSMTALRAVVEASRHASWVDDVSIHNCLRNAGTVFLVNSGVGFEAMLHEKPIVHFGRAEYSFAVPRAQPDPESIAQSVGRSPDVARYVSCLSKFLGHCVEIAEPGSFERVIEDRIGRIDADASARLARRRQVVMCGFARSGSTLAFNMMRSTVTAALLPERECTGYGYADEMDTDVVTKRPLDVFDIDRISRRISSRKSFRAIVTVRDVRSLVTSWHSSTGKEYFQGFDHCFKVNAGGLLSFSNPGVIETARKIRELVATRDDVMVVRYEDLISRTEETQERIRTFTGLEMTGSFREFYAADIPDLLRPQLNGVRPIDRSTIDKWKDARHRERVVRQFRLEPGLFEVLEDWGYEPDRVWFDRLAAETPEALDDSPGTVVAFFTAGTGYEAEARRLESTLKRLGLPHEFTAIASGGDWLANVRRKPEFLLDRRKALSGPLLYVDVDAVLHSDPWPYLRGYSGDVAVSTHPDGTVISGTILLNDTPGALRLLTAWTRELGKSSEAWDQWGLHTLVEQARQGGSKDEFRVQYLPPAMCYVFDRTRKHLPNVVPVVEHLQASREFRANSGAEKSKENLERRRNRISEIHQSLGIPAPEYEAQGLFGEGHAFTDSGDRALARRGVKQIFKTAKQQAAAGEHEKAAETYASMLKAEGYSDFLTKADIHFRIGLCLVRAGRQDAGAVQLVAAIDAAPDKAAFLVDIFDRLAKLGCWDAIVHGLGLLLPPARAEAAASADLPVPSAGWLAAKAAQLEVAARKQGGPGADPAALAALAAKLRGRLPKPLGLWDRLSRLLRPR